DTSSSFYSYILAIRPLFLPKDELGTEVLELRRASLALTLLYLASKSLVCLGLGLCSENREVLVKNVTDMKEQMSLTNSLLQNDPFCHICGIRRGIKSRNPQHVTKNCETYGSNVHTTSDHNDIEWFRKKEALQANRVESFKGNPQHALKDKGVIDSGCSRHMIGNMSYLSDFEELNGGYVSFGGNPKGGKISGKGKIKTGHPQHALKDKGVIDSGCSRHMIGNMSYLSNFEELNGGYVAFGGTPKGGKISGKAPESDEVIRLEKDSRSKLSDLIRPFDYEKLNNLYDLFVPQREKSSEQRYFSESSKISHTTVNNGNSKVSFNKQTTLLEKQMDESIPYDQKYKSSKEIFKIKRSVGPIIDGVERCKETIAKRTYFGHIDPFIHNTIEANFCLEI
nr:ribonuclease H-like domain-containing protein [Tanacetum cinerariifolium]